MEVYCGQNNRENVSGKSISHKSVQLPYGGGSIRQKMTSGVGCRLVVNIIKWSRWTHHNFPSTSLIWKICTLLWWVWMRQLYNSNNKGLASALCTEWYSPLAYTYSWRHLLLCQCRIDPPYGSCTRYTLASGDINIHMDRTKRLTLLRILAQSNDISKLYTS